MSHTLEPRPLGDRERAVPVARVLMWVAVAALFLGSAALRSSDGYTPFDGDYAQYLSHARALAEGRAYADIGYIYTTHAPSTGPRAYPPGLPLMLAPTFRLGDSGPVAARLIVVAFALGLVFLAGGYFAQREGHLVGASVALILGASPEIARAATHVETDVPFAALVWAVVWLADRRRPSSRWHLAALTVLGAYAILVRTAGIALVPAMILFALWRARERPYGLAAPVAVWIGVFVASNALLPTTSSYATELSLDPLSRLQEAGRNVVEYRFALFESHLYPFTAKGANAAYHIVALALTLLGLAAWLRAGGHRSFLACFALAYGGLLLIWHVATARYAYPLYPLLIFGLVRGIQVALRAVRPRWSGVRVAAGALAVAVALVISTAVAGRLRPRPRDIGSYPEIGELFTFVRTRGAAEGWRVAFFNPRVLTWHTRVPAMALFNAAPEAVLRELQLQGITHAVEGDLRAGVHADRTLRELMARHPSAFSLVYRNPRFSVYCFDPGALAAGRGSPDAASRRAARCAGPAGGAGLPSRSFLIEGSRVGGPARRLVGA